VASPTRREATLGATRGSAETGRPKSALAPGSATIILESSMMRSPPASAPGPRRLIRADASIMLAYENMKSKSASVRVNRISARFADLREVAGLGEGALAAADRSSWARRLRAG
jgi:hypothetical protein